MADFDGGVFVGIDSDAFGNGGSDTQFLDSLVEAALRGQEYYNIEGYDEFCWDSHVNEVSRNEYTETRPFTSLEWMTIGPPLWIPVLPYLSAVEVKGDYSVGDEGPSSSEDFDCKVELVGFGRHEFTLSNTHASTPYWAPFDESLTVANTAQNLTWTQLQFWGRGRVGAEIDSGEGRILYGNMLIDDTGFYSQGTGTMPNSTSPEVQITGLKDAGSQVSYFDHIHYDDARDAMVLNPPLDASFTPNSVGLFSISYLQLRGLTVRLRYDQEK